MLAPDRFPDTPIHRPNPDGRGYALRKDGTWRSENDAEFREYITARGAGLRTCGQVEKGAELVPCACGKYRQADKGHGYVKGAADRNGVCPGCKERGMPPEGGPCVICRFPY